MLLEKIQTEDRDIAQFWYENGNQMFKNGDYLSAAESYSTAIDYCSRKQQHLPSCNPDLGQRILLNRAQCYLNMREYASAVKDCSLVLILDSSCLKAYIRRAMAYEALGNFREGLCDAQSAATLGPPVSLIETIVKLSSRLRALLICDERAIAAEGRPDRMVTDRQTLRLNFLETLPRNVTIGVPFLLRLCIGNEFGLWDRSFLSDVYTQSSISTNFKIKESDDLDLSSSLTSKITPSTIAESIKVCIQVIHLEVDRPDPNLKAVNTKRSFVILSNKEDNCIGADGKVQCHLTFNIDKNSAESSITDDEYFVVLKFSLSHALPSGACVIPILSLPMHISTGKSREERFDKEIKSNKVDILNNPNLIIDKGFSKHKIIKSTSDAKEKCSKKSVTDKNINSIMNIDKVTCASCIRESHVGDVIVYVLESPGMLGIGGKVWDSTYVLVDFLTRHGSLLVTGKRIVELGSGTGITGLGLCNLNPLSVILTDFKEVVPLLNSNIDLNCIMINNLTVQDCIRFKFSARAFSWGTNLIKKEIIVNPIIKPNLDGNFKIFIEDKNDVEVCSKRGSERGSERGGITNTNSLLEVDLVIASDVVYDPAGYEPLVKSLCELLGGNYQLWDGESKPEGFGQEERKEDSDVTTESSYDDSANSNTKSDNDQIKHKIDPISMTNTNIDYSMSSAISCSTPTSSSSLVPVYPMCILAHRHRHPENQRFFDSLRSQEGIVVQLISRESGEQITHKVENEKVRLEDNSSGSALAVSAIGNIDDNNCNDTSTVLSDVELYKIYFWKNVI